MTDDEMIQLGNDADTLLRDEAFARFYKLAEQRLAESFLTTPFERRDRVSEIHLAKCGLDLFNQHLKDCVQARNTIFDRRLEEETPSKDDGFDFN